MEIQLVSDDGNCLEAIEIDKAREFGDDYKQGVADLILSLIRKAQEGGYR
jgi:hypothetical protein